MTPPADPVLDVLPAPIDPRTGWDVPAFGSMDTVTDLDDVVTRVIAPNPSAMTLDGTNTYIVGRTGSGACAIVDPGPDDDEHYEAVRAVLAERDAGCGLILVTHHHGDHAEAAATWADRFSCKVAAPTPQVAGKNGVLVHDNGRFDIGGLAIRAVATPGHTADHTSYRLETGALLTGDHVLGRGTTVVAHPDGDLADYTASLRRVLNLGPDALYPGHGPAITHDPSALTAYYLQHRRYRERQILLLLREGPKTASELVARIYAAYDTSLWAAAELSTLAGLHKLAADGPVAVSDDTWRLVI